MMQPLAISVGISQTVYGVFIFGAPIARVAELVDAYDSKSYGLWPCGFDSHPGYGLLGALHPSAKAPPRRGPSLVLDIWCLMSVRASGDPSVHLDDARSRSIR